MVCGFTLNHLDAVDDGTDRYAESAARTVLGDVRDMSLGVKCYRLVARVVARHVAFTAIHTHLFVNQRYFLWSSLNHYVKPAII